MTRFFYILFVIFLIPMTAQAMDSLPRLHVENNRLELPDGTPLTLRGVSLCSLSWHNPKRLLGTLTQGQNGWHVNVVRLPVQPEEWEQTGPGKYLKERLDPAIRQCRAGGLYCIIDWHEIADWDDPETARKLESFWRIVAPRYANNPLIMYEILNEPIGPKALNRENWLAYRDTAQKWVDMIREKAPDTVLLVGSPIGAKCRHSRRRTLLKATISYIPCIFIMVGRQIHGMSFSVMRRIKFRYLSPNGDGAPF